jgi:6-phosphogluconate dehydrogenase
MRIAMIGLGRMGGNIVRRLQRAGHEAVVFDRNTETVDAFAKEGFIPASGLEDLKGKLEKPAIFWVMLPAGDPTEETIKTLSELAEPGDIIIDGGNSFYKDDIRRAKMLGEGHRLYRCRHVGRRLGPRARLLHDDRRRQGGRRSCSIRSSRRWRRARRPSRARPTGEQEGDDPRAEKGYIHAGPAGAGHFVKMVHNGIEYGLMQAYAEGFDILKGKKSDKLPEDERFDLNLTDIAEVWRRGSVIRPGCSI